MPVPQQQQRLVVVYTDWSVATYARRFNDYSGESFRILPETESSHKTVTVISQLIKAVGGDMGLLALMQRLLTGYVVNFNNEHGRRTETLKSP